MNQCTLLFFKLKSNCRATFPTRVRKEKEKVQQHSMYKQQHSTCSKKCGQERREVVRVGRRVAKRERWQTLGGDTREKLNIPSSTAVVVVVVVECSKCCCQPQTLVSLSTRKEKHKWQKQSTRVLLMRGKPVSSRVSTFELTCSALLRVSKETYAAVKSNCYMSP